MSRARYIEGSIEGVATEAQLRELSDLVKAALAAEREALLQRLGNLEKLMGISPTTAQIRGQWRERNTAYKALTIDAR